MTFAPEIISGQIHDTSTDIWSLGAIGMQLLQYEQDCSEVDASKEAVTLFKSMVSIDPLQRPNIKAVLTAI